MEIIGVIVFLWLIGKAPGISDTFSKTNKDRDMLEEWIFWHQLRQKEENENG
jgi:hypothetical protein